jgi:hypothetical protein
MQQHLEESLRSFIQRFSQVRNTNPHISNAFIVVGFRQGVRGKKMLEKLATHDIAELFSLVDKCARAVKGHAWQSPPAPEARKAGRPDMDAATQSSGKKKKMKVGGKDKSLAGAPTTTTASASGVRGPHGDKHLHQASSSDDGGAQCPMLNSRCHNTKEYREIKKLAEQVCE